MKKQIAFFLIFLFSVSYIRAKIIETPQFREIVSHLTPETLIVLDIDDTLLIPVQMLGCDEWFNFRINQHQAQGMAFPRALEKSVAEWEAVRHLTQMEIVEPGIDEIIASLQQNKYCIMGMTSQGLALATRTSQQLEVNHIDLSLTAPCSEDQFFTVHGQGMLFRKGVLFTAGSPKGEGLFTFLDKIGFVPRRILFINDKGKYLQDVENFSMKRDVEFIGLRYSYSDARKNAFRPEVAELQFSHSTFTHLLSDEEALVLLKEKP